MPTLTLQVSAEFKARVIRTARQRKVSVSQLVRAAVEKELRVVETIRRGSASGG